MERLQKIEMQRLAEVDSLRRNGEDLRVKLKEAVDAHDQTVQAAKTHELENEKLLNGLVVEARRMDQAILSMDASVPVSHFSSTVSFLTSLA